MYLARRARKEARKSAAVDGVVLGDDSEGFSSEEDEEASLEEETDAEPSSANLHESAGMSYTPISPLLHRALPPGQTFRMPCTGPRLLCGNKAGAQLEMLPCLWRGAAELVGCG